MQVLGLIARAKNTNPRLVSVTFGVAAIYVGAPLVRCGEQCRGTLEVVIEGRRMRLPREPLEPLWSAWVHVVRNAVDHGLQDAAEPHLVLSAGLTDPQVTIAVSDKGAGTDGSQIRTRAERLGLPSHSQEDLVKALFADGFTARDEVTELPGRGAGRSAVMQVCDEMGAPDGVVCMALAEDLEMPHPLTMPSRTSPWSAVVLALAGLDLVGCAAATQAELPDAGVLTSPGGQPGSAAPPRKPPPGGEPLADDGRPDAPNAAPDEGQCGAVNAVGLCRGTTAIFCEAGRLIIQECRLDGVACAMDVSVGGFRCEDEGEVAPGEPVGPMDPGGGDPGQPPAVDGGEPLPPPNEGEEPSPDGGLPDNCGGITFLGVCEGTTAVFCVEGALQQVDCAQWAMTCGWVDEATGNFCVGGPEAPADPDPLPPPDNPDPVPPPGGGCDLGFEGECQGDVARYCLGEELVEVDCAAWSQSCGYIAPGVGYYCQEDAAANPPPENPPADACQGIDSGGTCQGDVVVWCEQGELVQVDCAAWGESCGYSELDGLYVCLLLI